MCVRSCQIEFAILFCSSHMVAFCLMYCKMGTYMLISFQFQLNRLGWCFVGVLVFHYSGLKLTERLGNVTVRGEKRWKGQGGAR
jgi:hypothetical protein